MPRRHLLAGIIDDPGMSHRPHTPIVPRSAGELDAEEEPTLVRDAPPPEPPFSLMPLPAAKKRNRDPFVPMVIPKSRLPLKPNKEGYVDPLLIACDKLWDEIESLLPRFFELEYLGEDATPEEAGERERLDFRIKELRAYSEFYRTIVIDYEWRKANPRYARFPKFFRF